LNDTLDRLKQALNEELAVYRGLLALSRRKQKLLLEKFSTDLLAMVQEEEAAIQKLADLETIRMECIGAITGNANATLDELVNKLTGTVAKSDIWMISSTLKDTINEIKELNTRNQQLLEQALELTQYSITLITTPPKEVTYKAPGKAAKAYSTPISKLIDRKA
jgi:flagellar biosynthesis/type III secretory pathway chaperone